MTGVGVGASPVFSGGGGSGSGDGDGSSGGTATPRSSPANTERALLKKMVRVYSLLHAAECRCIFICKRVLSHAEIQSIMLALVAYFPSCFTNIVEPVRLS